MLDMSRKVVPAALIWNSFINVSFGNSKHIKKSNKFWLKAKSIDVGSEKMLNVYYLLWKQTCNIMPFL
jgi:hypothetical protein